jgi:4-amino-4-deoxy-L-arabinose transferase-like glycosyltransferase
VRKDSLATIKVNIPFILIGLVIGISAWLRLANLGYSDYQGDEIKALAGPAAGQGLGEFLLEQRKGPLQYLLTQLVRLFHPSLTNEFLARLPFALAGIASVYLFYRLIEQHYGRRVGIYAALLLSVNGLFIGLTRIVQYQSLVILFSILALYCFSLALKSPRWSISGIYLGMLSWAAAMLAHYDGVFIAPFAAYLLGRWYISRTERSAHLRRRHLLISGLLALLLLGAFYIPFVFELRGSTLDYWLLRFTGEEQPVGIPSSLFTFQLYNPLLAIYLYVVFGLLSIFRLRKTLPVWLWFVFPWIVLEGIIADPGTHIYTYILPASILTACGISVLEDFLRRLIGERFSFTLVAGAAALAVVFLAGVSHLIFVDHTPEYPWEQRRILSWTVGAPTTGAPGEEYRVWAFGFPYNRQWEAIGKYVTAQDVQGYYSTNENKSIAGFYIPYPFDINRSGFYIHIYHPQSLRERLADDKIRYWTKNYSPIKSFETEGRVVAEIYDMPPGNIGEIRSQGY